MNTGLFVFVFFFGPDAVFHCKWLTDWLKIWFFFLNSFSLIKLVLLKKESLKWQACDLRRNFNLFLCVSSLIQQYLYVMGDGLNM